MTKRRDDAADVQAAKLAAGVTAYALGLDAAAVCAPGRGEPALCHARQVAMYLTHVAFEMSLARVAAAFGRDRSTAGHACHVVEERRDDEAFDRWLDCLEATLRDMPRPAPPQPAAPAKGRLM